MSKKPKSHKKSGKKRSIKANLKLKTAYNSNNYQGMTNVLPE